MSPSRRTWMISALSLLALSACGGDGSAPATQPGGGSSFGDLGGGGNGGGNSSEFNCPLLFDADAVARAKAQGPAATLGYHIEADSPLTECSHTQTVNGVTHSSSERGYERLRVIPKIRASGEAKIDPPHEGGETSGPRYLRIPFEIQALTPQLRAQIGAQLGIQASDDILKDMIVAGAPQVILALVGNLPAIQVELVVGPGPGAGTGEARIALDEKYVGEAAAFLPTFNNGTQPIPFLMSGEQAALETYPSFLAFQVRRINLFDTETALSSAQLAEEEWKRSKDRSDQERLNALMAAIGWLNDKPVPREEALAKLGDLLSYARRYWPVSPTPSDIADATAAESIYGLQLIVTIDPTDPARAYADLNARLAPFFMSEADQLREAITLVNTHPYSADQLDLIVEIARDLNNAQVSDSGNHWAAAKDIARAVAYNGGRARAVVDAASWLASNGGATPLATAEDYVVSRGLTGAQWAAFKTAETWLAGYGGPHLAAAAAMGKAESYVFQKHATGDQCLALARSYEWLADYSGPHLAASDALARAEGYAFDRGVTDSRLDLLKIAFSWLGDYSGPHQIAWDALVRAESYVLDRSMTLDQLELLKASYSWLTDYSGPHLAVAGAMTVMERWVFVKRMDDAKFLALKSAYETLARTMPSDQALAQAEQQSL